MIDDFISHDQAFTRRLILRLASDATRFSVFNDTGCNEYRWLSGVGQHVARPFVKRLRFDMCNTEIIDLIFSSDAAVAFVS